MNMTCFCCLQTAAALWISMLMSALAGMLAVSVVAAAFWWIRCDTTQVVPCALPAKSMRCQADDFWHHLPAVLLLCCKLCRGLTRSSADQVEQRPDMLLSRAGHTRICQSTRPCTTIYTLQEEPIADGAWAVGL